MEGQSIANQVKCIARNARVALTKQAIADAYAEIGRCAREGKFQYFLERWSDLTDEVVVDLKHSGFDVEKIGNGWRISWEDKEEEKE